MPLVIIARHCLFLQQVNGEERRYPMYFNKHLTIINIDIIYRFFVIRDHLVITFVNCNIINSEIRSKYVQSVHLQVVNSTFRGHVNSTCLGEIICRTTSIIAAKGKNASVWFKNTAFYQTEFLVQADYADKVGMHH